MVVVAGGACAADEPAGPPPPPVNKAPIVGHPAVTTAEDTPVEIRVLDAASDPDGDELTVTGAAASGHTVALLAGGVVRVVPKQDFYGMIRVSYTVSDASHSVAGEAVVTVTPVNDAPTAANSSHMARGGAKVVLEGDDVDGDALTYEIVAAPAHGTVSGTLPELSYVPDADFAGEDVLSYRVRDAELASEPAIVRLAVVPDAPPVVQASALSVDEDTALLVPLQASDAEGDQLSYSVVTPPRHGTLISLGAQLMYTPAHDFAGSDSIEFNASDGFRTSNTASIAIEVRAVNDAPVATAQQVAAIEDTSVSITLGGRDPEGDVLTFQVGRAPSHGALSGAGSTRSYTPAANYHGPDSFTFVASDASLSSAAATVTIDVAAVNDPPMANPVSRTLAEDSSAAVTLSSSDPDGTGSFTYAIATPPAHGTLTGFAPFLTYTPAANYNGADSFTYTVSDRIDTSQPATVTLAITPVHDTPVARDGQVTTLEDTAVAITLQADNPDGQPLTFDIITAPSDGTLTISGANVSYTPAPNATGSRSFTFFAFDRQFFFSNTATVIVTISPVDDPPTTIDDYLIAEPGVPLRFSVTRNDFDVEGDAFQLTSVDPPALGALERDGDQLTYTRAADATGVDVFSYQVTDVHGASSTGTVHIAVGAFPPGAPTETIATLGSPAVEGTGVTLSDDGRYIAFDTVQPLVDDDSNGLADVYVYDRGTQRFSRVSLASAGGNADGASRNGQISANGRYVAFQSSATNLVAGDSNGKVDVFRYDRVTGETVRISVAAGGGQPTGDSLVPRISDDGNVIAFRSSAFDLVGNDTNGALDIFVRDVAAGTTTRASVTATGGEADLGSFTFALSGNGRYVAFSSPATNLVAGDTNNKSDVFVRDLALGSTTRVSVSSTGIESNGSSGIPSLSRDGRYILFQSSATNLVPAGPDSTQLYVRDVQGAITTRPVTTSTVINGAQLSGDGRYITAGTNEGVFIHDRFAAVTVVPPGANFWRTPGFSGNGRYVAAIELTSMVQVIVTPNTL